MNGLKIKIWSSTKNEPLSFKFVKKVTQESTLTGYKDQNSCIDFDYYTKNLYKSLGLMTNYKNDRLMLVVVLDGTFYTPDEKKEGEYLVSFHKY